MILKDTGQTINQYSIVDSSNAKTCRNVSVAVRENGINVNVLYNSSINANTAIVSISADDHPSVRVVVARTGDRFVFPDPRPMLPVPVHLNRPG